MKKLILSLAPAMAFVAILASCNKVETPTVTPPVDTTATTSTALTPFTPSAGDANGLLAAVQMKYKLEQAGIVFDVAYETAVANFYNGSALVDAGTVSVNDIALEKQSNNSYLKMASTGMTVADLKYAAVVNWNVTGGVNGVPNKGYSHGTNFPNYDGELPTTITKANGVNFTFNSNTVQNADSVYVFIGTSNNKTYIKGFSPTAGSIKITGSDLSGIPTVSDNTAFLEVVPVKFAVETIAGKRYTFIKEQAVVRNVNIN